MRYFLSPVLLLFIFSSCSKQVDLNSCYAKFNYELNDFDTLMFNSEDSTFLWHTDHGLIHQKVIGHYFFIGKKEIRLAPITGKHERIPFPDSLSKEKTLLIIRDTFFQKENQIMDVTIPYCSIEVNDEVIGETDVKGVAIINLKSNINKIKINGFPTYTSEHIIRSENGFAGTAWLINLQPVLQFKESALALHHL